MQRQTAGQDNCAGISLIETGMIVVVAGLIFAAMFSSHSLVKAAELRSIITQADAYHTAFRTFEAKFGNAPGDYPIAVAQWGPITKDGNADGLILGWEREEVYAWQHLALAGILPETSPHLKENEKHAVLLGINAPASRVPNAGFRLTSSTAPIYGKRQGHLLELGATTGQDTGREALSYSALTASDARILDTKVDDGLPDGGQVFAVQGKDSTACVSEGTAITYLVGNEAPACRLVFWLN